VKDFHENKGYLMDRITGWLLAFVVIGCLFFIGYTQGVKHIEADAISSGNAVIKDGKFYWNRRR